VFFLLSKVLDLFLSPLTWGLLLLAAALPWTRRSANRWKRKRVLGALGLGVLLVAAASPTGTMMTRSLESGATATMRDGVTYDAVVLLGGIVDEGVSAERGQPAYNDNVERVIMTHRVLREGRARFVIVSGGTVDPKLAAFGEAASLARQLEDWGIAKDRIILEDRSRNTRENALYTKEIVKERGFERVLVLTSAFHMPRALDCFRAVDLPVDALPVDYRARVNAPVGFDVLPRAYWLHVTAAMTRELFGRLVYRVQGYGRGP